MYPEEDQCSENYASSLETLLAESILQHFTASFDTKKKTSNRF